MTIGERSVIDATIVASDSGVNHISESIQRRQEGTVRIIRTMESLVMAASTPEMAVETLGGIVLSFQIDEKKAPGR